MNEILNHCSGPILVGLDGQGWLSENPADFDWNCVNPRIGCNNLRCASCGAAVRWRERIGVKDWELFDPAELHDLEDWLTHSAMGVSEKPWIRFYICRCGFWPALTAKLPHDPQSERGPHLPWRCGGHLELKLPTELDGIPLSADMDLDALVSKTLPRYWPKTFDGLQIDGRALWLARLYHLLPDHEQRRKLGQAVGEALRAPAVELRAAALLFFLYVPRAAGTEQLAEVARTQRPLFSGHQDPVDALVSLEERLIQALKSRTSIAGPDGKPVDSGALGVLRDEILAGRSSGAIIFQLGIVDRRWLLEHAAAVAAASPQVLSKLVLTLCESPPEQLIPALRAVATAPGINASELRARVAERVSAAVRDHVLAEFDQP